METHDKAGPGVVVGERCLRVACVQIEPKVGENVANLALSLDRIEHAAGQGAHLIVLPELANSGYVFRSRSEAFAAAESIPDGPSVRAWSDAAARLGIYIASGIAEHDGGRLFNSAVLVGPEGLIGTYRKAHLWNEENLWFEPGDSGFPILDTPLGRIGLAICYDGWFPETYRLLALQGADIVCVPTNWVPIPGQREGQPPMATILAQAAAHSNSLYIACANRIGTERGQLFIGQSVIISYTGWPDAGPASADQSEILITDVDLSAARRKRNWNAFNQVLRDRRIDVYDEMLGSGTRRGWY